MNTKFIIFVVALLVILGAAFLLLDTEQNEATLETMSIEFRYSTNGQNSPQSFRVEEGQSVKVTVVSDVADEIHLHGYDISANTAPGNPGVIEFKADKTGRFEIELEKLRHLLGYVEVYPR